jgi:hypothetical protein
LVGVTDVGGNKPWLINDITDTNEGATVYVPSITHIFFVWFGSNSTW